MTFWNFRDHATCEPCNKEDATCRPIARIIGPRLLSTSDLVREHTAPRLPATQASEGLCTCVHGSSGVFSFQQHNCKAVQRAKSI